MNNKKPTIEQFYEKGTYLGSIEWEGCENYPVIKHSKFNKPICLFSGALSFRMAVGGELFFSKNHPEEVGKKLTLDDPLFDNTYKGDLTPGMDATFTLDGRATKRLSKDDKKKNGFFVDSSKEPMFGEGENIKYVPAELKDTEIITGRDIKMIGQIVVELPEHFIVDVGAYVFIKKGKEYKLGDWIEGNLGEIDLV